MYKRARGIRPCMDERTITALEHAFQKKILPQLQQEGLALRFQCPRKDLIDIHLLKGKRDSPLAEIRIDLLSSPAILHLFTHQFPLDASIKHLLEKNLGQLEKALKKSIQIDSSYSDALHHFTQASQKLAHEVNEFRESLNALTKVHHTAGFPRFGYASIPPSLRGFGAKVPTSMSLEIFRGKIFPRTAVHFNFRDLHGENPRSCTISLSKDLYKEVGAKLRPSLMRLQDGMERIFDKAIHTQYFDFAKA